MIRQILHTAAALAFLVSPVCAQDGAVNPSQTYLKFRYCPGWLDSSREA
jgi:hypothetical protein